MNPQFKSIILYDTLFGCTEKIAKSLSVGIAFHLGQVDCLNIKDAKPESVSSYNLIVVGAPTQAFSASRPMKDFLDKLRGMNLAGRQGFAFDTKLDSRLSGSAAKYIESRLRELGLELVESRQSAMVKGGTKSATLVPGEEEAFEQLGERIGARIWQKLTVEERSGWDHTSKGSIMSPTSQP